jgi:collagenase-like PrtC family protease
MYQNQEQARLSAQEYAKTIDQSVKKQNQCPCLKFLIMNPKPVRRWRSKTDLLMTGIKSKKPEGRDRGYQYVLSNPGPQPVAVS